MVVVSGGQGGDVGGGGGGGDGMEVVGIITIRDGHGLVGGVIAVIHGCGGHIHS